MYIFGINVDKWISIITNTAPQVLLQLLCPWHISLHWSIAIVGGFLYLLGFFWLFSVLKIRKGALVIEHILILITIFAAIGELWLAKMLDEPLLIIRHRKELNFQINRFKKKCPIANTTFYTAIETKITTWLSLIKSCYNNCKSNIIQIPTRIYNFIKKLMQKYIALIKKTILEIRINITKILEYIRSKF